MTSSAMAAQTKSVGMVRTVLRRFVSQKMAFLCFIIIMLQIIMAVFAPWIAPYGQYEVNYAETYAMPSKAYLFGNDDLGRDVLSRLIYGARVSLSIGILSQLAALLIGLPIGALAGLLGGWVDFVVTRFIEILTSIPTIFLYILLMIALGPGFKNLMLAMAITGWTGIARLVRGQVLSLSQTDYVRASKAMGGNTTHIITSHLLRNALTPVIVSLTFGVPSAMMAEAGLSYLGLGINPPAASWGQMMGLYQALIRSAWHLTLFPALLLALTMLLWYQFGEGLRAALDPSLRV